MIDVQIVTYNSAPHIKKCLEALFRQQVPINVEVLDNNSQDETCVIIEKSFPQVKLHRSKINLGFGRGHNELKGESPYLLLLNPDAFLMPGALNELTKAAENSDAVAWEARQFPYEHPKIYDPVTLETAWVSGACVLLRRSAFEEVGGFEPKIFLYGEDVDLSFRLRNMGYRLLYCPKAKVEHVVYENTPKHAYLGSTLANLYLRTRFGSHGDTLKGICFYLMFSFRKYPFDMLRNFFVYLRNFWTFYRTRQRKVKPTFYGFNYTEHRLGVFYAQKNPKIDSKVSVLIRTTGQKKCLDDALKCLENQTYENFEVVLVEDGPATWKKNTSLEVNYIALGENKGRSFAGNVALREAKGEYFIFLDEDDLFFADHLEQLVAVEGRVAYSLSIEVPTQFDSMYKIIKEGKKLHRFRNSFSFSSLLQHNYIPILNILFHRSLYEKEGGFLETLQGNEDWHLWLRYSLIARPFIFVEKTTALYRVPYNKKDNLLRRKNLQEQERLAKEFSRSLKVDLSVGELRDLMEEVYSIRNILKYIKRRIRRLVTSS